MVDVDVGVDPPDGRVDDRGGHRTGRRVGHGVDRNVALEITDDVVGEDAAVDLARLDDASQDGQRVQVGDYVVVRQQHDRLVTAVAGPPA